MEADMQSQKQKHLHATSSMLKLEEKKPET